MSQPRPVVIDCDPGVDDVVALLLAAGSPALEVRAVTTVAGNVPLAAVTQNARYVAALAGLDVPVAAGCDRPLLRPPIVGPPRYHGAAGLGERALEGELAPLSRTHAVDLLIDTVLGDWGEVTLIPIGPLTNLAVALRREPRLAEAVREIVLMGGSTLRGNQTPAAEFNLLADPEAAAVVFDAPWPLTMVGLNLTHQAQATPLVRARIAALEGRSARLAADLLEFAAREYPRRGMDGPPVHDPCAVARVLDADLVRCQPAQVRVETQGRWTSGMTVVDLEPVGATSHQAAVELDRDRFWGAVIGALGRLP